MHVLELPYNHFLKRFIVSLVESKMLTFIHHVWQQHPAFCLVCWPSFCWTWLCYIPSTGMIGGPKINFATKHGNWIMCNANIHWKQFQLLRNLRKIQSSLCLLWADRLKCMTKQLRLILPWFFKHHWSAKTSNEYVAGLLKYKLFPYPMTLFDEGCKQNCPIRRLSFKQQLDKTS